MLYFMEDYGAESLVRTGNAVILRGTSDRPWVYVSATGREEIIPVAASLTPCDQCFAAAEDWMVPILVRSMAVKWDLTMMKWVLPGHVPDPSRQYRIDPATPITPLSEKDAPFIFCHSLYKDLTSPTYIRERIKKGPSAGIYLSGRPAAWAMTHDDGSIGLMHVLEPYRQRGYARALTLYLADQVAERGRTPYLHTEEQNTKAIALIKTLGFKPDRKLHWFELTPV